jgi:hypothetical protein
MPGLLADENFNHHIVRLLQIRGTEIDIVLARNVGLGGADDARVLAWAADDERIILTHDFQTLPGFAFDRVRAGLKMSGVIAVQQSTEPRIVAEQILMIVYCCVSEEIAGHVLNVPF